jgi:CspA family cold shock protein
MGDWCAISEGFARIWTGAGAHFRKETLMATMTGTIKRMVSDKGFGFIAAGDGTEYFFHQSACTSTRFDDMREGETVSFTVGQGPKGPRAENVQPA